MKFTQLKMARGCESMKLEETAAPRVITIPPLPWVSA